MENERWLLIGTCGRLCDKRVFYDPRDRDVRIEEPDVFMLMVGNKNKKDAIERCKRELINFIPAKEA